MARFEVELRGDSREVYEVEAESEEQARQCWHEGELILSEVFGMGVESVRESEED